MSSRWVCRRKAGRRGRRDALWWTTLVTAAFAVCAALFSPAASLPTTLPAFLTSSARAPDAALLPSPFHASSAFSAAQRPSADGDGDDLRAAASGRVLLQLADEGNNTGPASNATEEEGTMYPPELISDETIRKGGFLLYLVGILYMFFGLAIVCDDYFVPALEVITDKLNLGEDVAGATFMAAGGSAPELFTSLLGEFVAKSNIGFGTIIGSAVFNVMFVIGACAFATVKDYPNGLPLTWWPLFRDSSFYAVDLGLLTYFFSDKVIQWWESLVLFCMYLVYVAFMSQSETVHAKLNAMLGKDQVNLADDSHSSGVRLSGGGGTGDDALLPLQTDGTTPSPASAKRDNKSFAALSVFYDHEMQLATPLKSPTSLAASFPVAGSGGGGGGSGSGVGSAPGRSSLLGGPPTGSPTEQKKFCSFSQQDGIELGAMDVDKSHVHAFADDESPVLGGEDAAGGGGGSDDEDDGEPWAPCPMPDPAESLWEFVKYFTLFPINFALWLTVPNCTVDEKKKWFVLAFLLSILWIAFFTYFMVWWAESMGRALGIPTEVMGYTLLAAGTSVPDLITSVLVARLGRGDMAVSSSIGSNIFDITFGLPLPWLVRAFSNGLKEKNVTSKSLGSSVAMLIIMLVSIIGCIACMGWVLNMRLGIVCLVLYSVFVTISLLMEYEVIELF
eukprot:Rhum_TRINITY_DN14706_c15_g1::Rhum_TRINITY_DN14706_c15_g1_i1::g.112083::m.112083/K13750/SLC24A2, NCKX2; solute carrier family 24 (sodium/potassium/calcium exchanger), member 2